MRQTPIAQVRKIHPTRRSVSGVYMFRGETPIEYESTLERDFVVRKEFLLGVLDVTPQPRQIEYRDPVTGRPRIYTPDFFVIYRLGDSRCEDYPRAELVEVKPRAKWRRHWREWLPKWKAAHRWAKEYGAIFRVYDESRIRDQAFRNITFLERYKRMSFPAEESAWVLKNLAEMGMATVDYLLTRHFMGLYRAEGITHLWHLLATRRIDCDISRPLSGATEVWRPEF
jgi:hypothetical protein